MAALSYLPRLDGLRAVAVSAVLVTHLAPNWLTVKLGLGGLGVHLFFVISGFLITRILLNYQAAGVPLKDASVEFYWRRIVRLSPVLYAAIAITAALGIGTMTEDWWVHALYLTNFQIALEGDWGTASHFWSLSVEEQFYLFWFFFILLIPRRFLLRSIVAVVAIGPAFRLVLASLGINPLEPGPGVLLPGKIDGLAMGALLGLSSMTPHLTRLYDAFRSWRLLVLSGAVLFTSAVFLRQIWAPHAWYLGADVFACCCVRLAIDAKKDWRLDWLGWKPVRHIGKISYGLYVYHYFVPAIVFAFFPRLASLQAWPEKAALSLSFIVCSLLVAELSWYVLEKPMLALKNRPPWISMPRQAVQRQDYTGA